MGGVANTVAVLLSLFSRSTPSPTNIPRSAPISVFFQYHLILFCQRKPWCPSTTSTQRNNNLKMNGCISMLIKNALNHTGQDHFINMCDHVSLRASHTVLLESVLPGTQSCNYWTKLSPFLLCSLPQVGITLNRNRRTVKSNHIMTFSVLQHVQYY